MTDTKKPEPERKPIEQIKPNAVPAKKERPKGMGGEPGIGKMR